MEINTAAMAEAEPVEPPARTPSSCFGIDGQLADDLPPNWTLERFQGQVKSVLKEYYVCPAVDDTATQIADLLRDCPVGADEFVVLAIRSAIDDGREGSRKSAVDLLTNLYGSSTIDKSALIRSFEKLFCTWEDIAVDAPKAPVILRYILQACISSGIVERNLLTKLPESLVSVDGDDDLDSLADIAAELKEFKKEATKTLEEYFRGFNIDEVATRLKEIKMSAYHHEFVKKAMTLSFSQSDAEKSREATLDLLSRLSAIGLLSKDDIQWGVTRHLGQMSDLELDCPRAAELATELCANMVAEELVSVPFLRRCRQLRIGGPTGLRVIDGVHRRTPEYSKRHLGTTHFKREIQSMILEYFNAGDVAEFGRCVRELSPMAPEKAAELIRKIMAMAMERTDAERKQAIDLLVWLYRQEELDDVAMERGFDDLYAHLADISLDAPGARGMAKTFVLEAQEAKVLNVESDKLAEWIRSY